ncbi:CYTH domain-containing protein [Thiohalobacter thiocyanaticus]|uniref:CYTH domain-containing protein n=1 Tax=Thiohalobacter thiocyanaticus TaxID=585455 RepID=A0A426QED1_9GAMM|nr:CYTH domain-containing protein [Thiohalobacter thiocyanaticus]RRQ20097.1 CYTH domain-containing protein [Thiohalobacter thiocyanaticus]
MPIEIERKFLVTSDAWREQADAGVRYRQGYLTRVIGETDVKASVRVRTAGDKAWLNIKSAELGIRRLEYEYAIPLTEAEEMLDSLSLGRLVEKTRYHVPVAGHVWEVDVFEGDNRGLVVAEIELQSEDEAFTLPDWAGADVSDDRVLPRSICRSTLAQRWK